MSKPRIAICCEFEEWQPEAGRDRSYLKLYHHYYHALSRAGALPVALPVFEDPALALELLPDFDGVLLTGGDDIPGELLNEETHPKARLAPPWRVDQDFAVARWLVNESRQPVLGICMGMQMLNVADGGSLFQDIPSQCPASSEHRNGTRHSISVNRDSHLFRAIQIDNPVVNSWHHQAVQRPGRRFRGVAIAEDRIIEAVEMRDLGRWLVGVQWHPEMMVDDEASLRLFGAFVGECAAFRHQRRFSVDGATGVTV